MRHEVKAVFKVGKMLRKLWGSFQRGSFLWWNTYYLLVHTMHSKLKQKQKSVRCRWRRTELEEKPNLGQTDSCPCFCRPAGPVPTFCHNLEGPACVLAQVFSVARTLWTEMKHQGQEAVFYDDEDKDDACIRPIGILSKRLSPEQRGAFPYIWF